MKGEGLIFVIDDDESVRESTESLFRSAKLKVKAFASAEEFLRTKRPDVPACLRKLDAIGRAEAIAIAIRRGQIRLG